MTCWPECPVCAAAPGLGLAALEPARTGCLGMGREAPTSRIAAAPCTHLGGTGEDDGKVGVKRLICLPR
jgi:hypothetical protein